MPPTTIAHQVNQHIFMEVVSIRLAQAYRGERRIRVICINMNNGDFKSLRQVASELRGSAIFWLSCKAKLVVHDDVNGPTDPVAMELPQVQSLCYNPFTGKSCITMNEHR